MPKKQFNQLNLEQILEKISEENITKLKHDEAKSILIQANALGNLYRANLKRSERAGNIYKAKILGEQKKEQSFADYEFKLPETKGLTKGQERNIYLARLRKVRHFLRAKTKTVEGNKQYLETVGKILGIDAESINLSQDAYDEFWKQVSRVQKTDQYKTILMQKTYSSEQLVRDAYSSMTDPLTLFKDNLQYLSAKEIMKFGVFNEKLIQKDMGDKQNFIDWLESKDRSELKKFIIGTEISDPQLFIEFITAKARKLNEITVQERERDIAAKENELLYGHSIGRKD